MADLIDREAATEKLQTILAYHRNNAASGVVGTAVEERMAAAVESCIAAIAALPAQGVRALVAAETERCAKIADRYHAQAMEWVKSQPWLKDHTGETDSSRIAAAIREGRNG